jgi:hypothetical protein
MRIGEFLSSTEYTKDRAYRGRGGKIVIVEPWATPWSSIDFIARAESRWRCSHFPLPE